MREEEDRNIDKICKILKGTPYSIAITGLIPTRQVMNSWDQLNF